MNVVLEEDRQSEKTTRQFDRRKTALQMPVSVAVDPQAVGAQRSLDLPPGDMPMAAYRSGSRRQLENMFDDAPDALAVSRWLQEIGMNPEFDATLARCFADGRACMRDEDRRLDCEPVGDGEEILDAIFRSPIKISTKNKFHRLPPHHPNAGAHIGPVWLYRQAALEVLLVI
jgi:hypothetical protein